MRGSSYDTWVWTAGRDGTAGSKGRSNMEYDAQRTSRSESGTTIFYYEIILIFGLVGWTVLFTITASPKRAKICSVLRQFDLHQTLLY